MNFSLENLLVLDIETVRSHKLYEEMPERLQTQWNRKADFLRKEEEETDKEIYENKGGIYAEFGKVVAISVGFFTYSSDELSLRVKAIFGDDEKTILNEFNDVLGKFNSKKLIHLTVIFFILSFLQVKRPDGLYPGKRFKDC